MSRRRPRGDSEATSTGTTSLVDCDVHPFHVPDELLEYLSPEYADHGFTVPHGLWSNPHDGFRGDAAGALASVPGSDPELLYRDVVEEMGVDYPVLNGGGILLLAAAPQFDYAHALAKAYNDWLVDKWLDFDDHFVGSLAVAPQRPEKAAAEIRRVGGHPQIRQVIMGSATETPLGRERYWPIYEAAEELDLPVAVHPGSVGAGICPPQTGAGHPTTFFETHVGTAAHYVDQLVSLVARGTFVEYPDLDYVFLEGGFTWAPSAMWRMDNYWEAARSRVADPETVPGIPDLDARPSEYVREHCYFGTQPIPEPDDWADLQRTIEIMHGEDTLVYCSDYPHWDTDDRDAGLPDLPEPLAEAVFHGNARELYDLPDDGRPLV
jgi:predicted TIM-barrel fold metal-dependent hydrolase